MSTNENRREMVKNTDRDCIEYKKICKTLKKKVKEGKDSNSQTGENTRRNSTQRTGRIQRRVLNDRSHPCHKSTEGEVPVQTQAEMSSLQDQGIEDAYIQLMKDIYTDSSVTVYLHKESEKINIKRGVRQGDTISPKLFTSTLESIFRRLNWENKGLKIDGEYLNHLRFADDTFLCTETPQELEIMLQELCEESNLSG